MPRRSLAAHEPPELRRLRSCSPEEVDHGGHDGAGDCEPEPWAQGFDDWLADTLEKGDEAALADYRARTPYASEAHPTDEHFLPLHVAYGAAGAGAHGRALHRSFTLGNLSMASYAFA